ncbi:deoxyribose-phosphate aldolase [Candidiatus Paracoxiella cheracis]|uniref:deoxyribose-phosphate aldolase n=1 Tax=Candidiatus Paracoxiella cheracis TaxID=3405120 RepID=UPI003BF50102
MNSPYKQVIAKQLIPLLDLTNLNDDDTPKSIEKLCQQASTPFGEVAAVCIYPKFVGQAKNLLVGTSIKIATVVNFPNGNETLSDCVTQIKRVIQDGADEIDVVMPYEAYMRGQTDDVLEFLQACRGIMGPDIVMKVILETGALIYHELIAGACEIAIRAKADFIKTSTGKINPGASPQAAEIILNVIKKSGEPVGFKAAGGVRTVEQATEYLSLAENIMGKAWISAKKMRFGASSLLQDILS